ncbi:C-type lectin domain and von Willebrand factor, type A domain and C-type lectin-like domain and C-type lectin fold domain-containing protein [Strongyloides ratti]|uniref:C-type lectin domain and von Willebrand factor, type A domain and C-type lectin-like domain and C-type lectin fold domain-containing protein n=1 Tax=Strongyloides ratti TaxID=34506 RepID=A0A090LBP7_STRRB|nr:C-type lectin domain and von Willebrand factor, type A domain and C-type lectin-like domain and C-type lectin fold domain-containing protein [Strongyloides ratti]CEF64960.1 C-type lectin domain and von Willebrand factor, type A domain and C-type lectin-like domain and C-type lectin fold domain-containing protein [Strongyloides ratti]
MLVHLCYCYYDINIIITLDASEDIGNFRFAGIKATITSLLKDNLLIFKNSTSGTKVGIVYYGTSIEKTYYVNDFNSVEDVIDTIINLKFLGGESESLTTVFRDVKNIFNHETFRKVIPTWIIHFTLEPSLDCNYNDYQGACLITKELKKDGAIVTIVNLISDESIQSPTNEMGSPSYSLPADVHLVENLHKVLKNISVEKNPIDYSLRYCDRNISSLWIDIIFVIDTSINMAKEGTLSLFGTMISYLSTGFSYNTSDPFYSRLSIITAGDDVTIMTKLSDEKNLESIIKLLNLIKFTNSSTMNTYKVLENVENIIVTDKENRKEVPTMIVFMTANDNYNCNDNLPPNFCSYASRIKNRPNTFIVNIDVGSPPGMDISNDNNMLSRLVEISLDINCFCPTGFAQFISPNGITKSGECIFWQPIPAGYRSAQYACFTLGGTLADTTSMYKYIWLKNYSQNMSFWIGLNNMNGLKKFSWDNDKSLVDNVIIESLNITDNNYSHCVLRTETGTWEASKCSFATPSHSYFCQINSCDTKTNCL